MNEFDIIARYFAGAIRYNNSYVVIGPGDDCAVMQVPPGHALCVSTDTLIEGVHFPTDLPSDLKGEITANRAMAANLSDLAAMGAQPYGFTLAITLPEVDEAWLASFSSQLNKIVNEYKIPLIGGNISKGALSLTINIMGLIESGKVLLRSGAGVGDKIFVSGQLGSGAGGLKCHQQGLAQSDLSRAYFNPVPRISLGQNLIGLASACIDISDGLASDLRHICDLSGVGAEIYCADLPLADSLVDTFGLESAENMALSGGDDYELCFTVPESKLASLAAISSSLDLRLTCIGECIEVIEGEDMAIRFLDAKGKARVVPSGYQHF